MAKFKDLTGQTFNRLTVLKQVPKRVFGNVVWLCECSCGNTTETTSASLNSGNTKSCGCLGRQRCIERSTKHSMSRSVEYNHWSSIKSRCLNPNSLDYKDYGAKGITMQESWINDFAAFYEHIGPKPEGDERYSVDRIDRTRGYEEGNVRWADDKTQSRNRGMQRSNTSGYTGVRRMTVPHDNGQGEYTYWQARWNDLEGKRTSKQYSVDIYGDELAEFLAIETREIMIMRQQQIEGNYAEDFGK